MINYILSSNGQLILYAFAATYFISLSCFTYDIYSQIMRAEWSLVILFIFSIYQLSKIIYNHSSNKYIHSCFKYTTILLYILSFLIFLFGIHFNSTFIVPVVLT